MLLTTFIKRLESYKLYRQERVNRWQMREYMFTSNDATHQLYVTQIVLILADLFKLPDEIVLKTIKYACCHDFVECTEDSLGDVNYMLKEKNPELKAIVKQQEEIAMKNVPEFYKAMKAYNNSEDITKTLFDLADALEALFYVRREIRSNKQSAEWEQIEIELMPRIEENWNILSKFSTGG